MIFKIEGKPAVYTHPCDICRKGQQMTAEELHEFAVAALLEAYHSCDYLLFKYDSGVGADFMCQSTGGRYSFKYDGAYPICNVLVVCAESDGFDLSQLDTAWMMDEYLHTGNLPHVVFAKSFCVSEGHDAGDTICGLDYFFSFDAVSLAAGENEPLKEKKPLTSLELAVKFSEAWKNQDASIVAPYLDKDFSYHSDWVFDEIPSRKEFLDYFTCKLATIGKDDFRYQIVHNRQSGLDGVVISNKNSVSLLQITCSDGRIMAASMTPSDSHFKMVDMEDELYQTHGDHIEGFSSSEEFVSEVLPLLLKESLIVEQTTQIVTTDALYSEPADIYGMLYGEGAMKMCSSIAVSGAKDTNEFISTYPLLEGSKVDVIIEKVIEWDNQLEATVKCFCGDFHFAFFATDYFKHKSYYRVGSKLPLSLSALGIEVDIGEQSFSIEGEEAVEWLKKMGKEPVYDFNGNVEPVRISMEQMVAYVSIDSKCPDEALFQSPVKSIEDAQMLGIDFYKAQIIIHKDEKGKGISVPIYFRKDFLPHIEVGMPLGGHSWLTGQIEPAFVAVTPRPKCNELADMAFDFVNFMSAQNFNTFEDLNFVKDQLPLLKIREGYILDGFECGNEYGWRILLYCCKDGSQMKFMPYKEDFAGNKVINTYDDSEVIGGRMPYEVAEQIPDVLGYFSVPFTQEGILQAWLLDNASEFMPLGWHAGYGRKNFLFIVDDMDYLMQEEYDIDENRDMHQACRELLDMVDRKDLEPSVVIYGNEAELSYAYWNGWTGLVKAKVHVTKKGETVAFGEPKLTVLVPYSCGIRF